jgi:hypothetical protein
VTSNLFFDLFEAVLELLERWRVHKVSTASERVEQVLACCLCLNFNVEFPQSTVKHKFLKAKDSNVVFL